MKVIFLDVDGVLSCDRTPNPRKFPYVVDKGLLKLFNGLLLRSGAKVVLSSTWRCDPIGLLAAKYWRVPFIDITPDTRNTGAILITSSAALLFCHLASSSVFSHRF